jgi:hypothetical protein
LGNLPFELYIEEEEFTKWIASLTTLDEDYEDPRGPATNYVITFDGTSVYTIEQRELTGDYLNELQSINTAFSDVFVNHVTCGDTDITEEELKSLLVGDGIYTDITYTLIEGALQIVNNWKAIGHPNYEGYTRIIGSGTEGDPLSSITPRRGTSTTIRLRCRYCSLPISKL